MFAGEWSEHHGIPVVQAGDLSYAAVLGIAVADIWRQRPLAESTEQYATQALQAAKSTSPFGVGLNSWPGSPVGNSSPPARNAATGREALYASFRARGRRLWDNWWRATHGVGNSSNALAFLDGVRSAFAGAREVLGWTNFSSVNCVDLCFTHSYQDVKYRNNIGIGTNLWRGVHGLEVAWRQELKMFAPMWTLAENLKHDWQVEKFRQDWAAEYADLSFRRMQCVALLVCLDSGDIKSSTGGSNISSVNGEATPLKSSIVRSAVLQRGNTPVSVEDVTRAAVVRMCGLASTWLLNAIQAGGRLTYMYRPSANEESNDNNMIRQWMATIALGRVATAVKAGLIAIPTGDATVDLLPEGKESELQAAAIAQRIWELAAVNIDYNLQHYYVHAASAGVQTSPLVCDATLGQTCNEEHYAGLPHVGGEILYQGESRLGAIALAAYALHHHPEQQRSGRWVTEEMALRRTLRASQRDDGSFRLFVRPAGLSDSERGGGFENFYPGETLFYWAALYTNGVGGGDLLQRILLSFHYYREYHRQASKRKPSFIPWHTQALYQLWRTIQSEPQNSNWHFGLRNETFELNRTKICDEIMAFVFEMNDFLVGFQQWEWRDSNGTADGTPDPSMGVPLFVDIQGRFADAKRPHLGPPHASATGVYIEGLADAYRMAAEAVPPDPQRQRRYAGALIRALRSALQLQFADSADMFYVPAELRHRVRGGIRTTVYNNEIRCDNVQHILMGAIKVIRAFDEHNEAWKPSLL